MNEALSGDAFDALLDEVIATARDDARDEEEEAEQGPDQSEDATQRKAAARALLASRALAPDDFDSLRRLYHVWVWLDQPAEAHAALDAHQARLALDLDDRARAEMTRECAFLRFDAAAPAEQPPAEPDATRIAFLKERFDAVADAITASARGPQASDAHRDDWERLLAQSRHYRLAYGVERAARELHALCVRQPERQHWRAWDDACLQLRLGAVAQMQGDAAQAHDLGLKAFMTLAKPIPGQQIELGDWLRLAPEFLRCAPDVMDMVAGKAREALGADAGPARFRDLEVQLARWLAKAKWAQGAHDRALTLARQGRYMLTGDHDDTFGAELLDWLLAQGLEAEAASLAFDAAWNGRSPSGQRAVAVAAQRLASADAPQNAAGIWALVLAAASQEEALTGAVAEALGRPCNAELVAELMGRAQAANPTHPAAAVLAGRQLLGQGKADQALPLLERLQQAPDLANSDVAMELYEARLRVLGPKRALAAPVVDAGSAHWCYALGVNLSDADEVMNRIQLPAEQRASFPGDELDKLSTHYYERALQRFEAFFATGKGHMRDGDIHTYSMNCNNLAIDYRYDQDRPADALVLHQKGLQASPFAEHKLGAMWCYYDLDQYPEFLEAAEQLWHFSHDHGFGRHDPGAYFDEVAWALQNQNRYPEIDIWLDRLQQWQRDMHPEERQEEMTRLLALQASLLDYVQPHRPEDVLARMRAIAPALMSGRNPYGLRRLGDGLLASGQPQEALAAYERAVEVFDPEANKPNTLERAREGVTKARKAVRAQNPWWRRWTA